MEPDQVRAAERSRDFERFITFVDAIVAIAITLLVLPLVDLTTELDGGSVSRLLSDHAAELWGFGISFTVIASLWFVQHRILRNVIAQDPVVVRLLLAWTLTIVVLPFPTALVAQQGHQPATKVFYMGTLAVSSMVLAVMCWSIGRNRAIRDSDEKPDMSGSVGSAIGFLVALGISLAFPATGYYPLLVLLLPDPITARWRRHRLGRSGPVHPTGPTGGADVPDVGE